MSNFEKCSTVISRLPSLHYLYGHDCFNGSHNWSVFQRGLTHRRSRICMPDYAYSKKYGGVPPTTCERKAFSRFTGPKRTGLNENEIQFVSIHVPVSGD